MLPLRRWPLPGLGPVWLSEPQPACRVLWPSSHRLIDRVMNDMEKQMQEMEKLTRAFFQASPLLTWERDKRQAPQEEESSTAQTGADCKGQPAGKYQFSVDVAGFSPEEMTVKLDGRKVTVTAKRQRQSKTEEAGYWQEHQELRRETLLPLDVDLQAVTCSLSSGGQLCIEAPCLASPATTAKAIPINMQSEATAGPEASAKEEKEPDSNKEGQGKAP